MGRLEQELDPDLEQLNRGTMPDRAFTRLHRVTDLFVTGRELVIQDDGSSEPILLWIKKPNTFELADIQRDASAARSRRMAALVDDSDEVATVRIRLAGMPRADVIQEIVSPQRSTAYLQAMEDVQADPAWTENLELLRRQPGLEDSGSEGTDDEREQLEKLNRDYIAALEAATQARLADTIKDLEDLTPEDLEAKYVETWRDQVSRTAWTAEYARAEIFLAARDCTAVRAGNGRYDHAGCTHVRFIPSRAAVYDLPDELIERIQQVVSDLKMSPADAGNSDAPQNSSEPAEQPSKAEESAPSTPPET